MAVPPPLQSMSLCTEPAAVPPPLIPSVLPGMVPHRPASSEKRGLMAQAQALTEATWTPEPSVAFLKGNPLKFHPLQYQFSAGDTLVLTGPSSPTVPHEPRLSTAYG